MYSLTQITEKSVIRWDINKLENYFLGEEGLLITRGAERHVS